MNILDLPMGPNDADAVTVRDYLKALLSELWRKEDGFSGKRPFGNSGWQCEIHAALIKAGAITGKLDLEGCVEEADTAAGDILIQGAIDALQ